MREPSFVRRVVFVAALAAILPFMGTWSAGQPRRPDFDATRLQQGTFRYRTVVEGKDAGRSEIEVRALPGAGRYRYTNDITGAFSQRWEATATRAFEPISAQLLFGEGTTVQPMFELTYQDGRVRGMALQRRLKPPTRREVDDVVSADTVDQRIDWAAVMSVSSLDRGLNFEFRVYDPETGNSRVSVEVGETAMTTVPAGTFETARVVYRIDKNRGAETYVALVKKAVPRFLVHETFPNNSTTELVAVSP
jgi:hypothetical protein